MTARRRIQALDWLLLATLFVTTWHKIFWQSLGDATLEDILAMAFLAVFGLDRLTRRDARLPRDAAALLVALLALEAVFLCGYFDLVNSDALTQYAKGMAKYLIHFAFLIAAVAHVVRRGRRLYFLAAGALVGGIAFNAVYGVFQLGAKVAAGANLDEKVVGPLTFGQGGVGGINVFGRATTFSQFGTPISQGVFRINALALDPNHLGIMLDVPILLLLPFAMRLGLRRRRGRALALLIAFLAVVQLLTLSRSAYFGLAFGLLVLAGPYARRMFSPRLVLSLLVILVVVGLAASQSHYVRTVFKTRVSLSDRSAQAHYQIFALVPPVLQEDPFFGLGLNTFSVYYEFQTGRTDWGPHSFYVALIAETGLVGVLAFSLFLGWLFLRLVVLHREARRLRRARAPDAAVVQPLAWGLTAAYVATLAANVFYLTMQFYYFYALVLLIAAAPALWAPARAPVPAREEPGATVPAPA